MVAPISDPPKTRLAVVCGGQSGEHEISLLSAHNVLKALDPNKFSRFVLGIEKNGTWAYYPEAGTLLLDQDNPKKIKLNPSNAIPAAIVPTAKGPALIRLHDAHLITHLDVAFSVLHGPFGEDGTIQGLFKMMGLPCVGCQTLSASMTMDKVITKRLLLAAGLPTAPFISLEAHEADRLSCQDVITKLGLPFFIKPANAGSSLGISKVVAAADFEAGIAEAFQHDRKILLESAIVGRELECAVLGNESPRASVPGEIIPQPGTFYSYAAKYLDDTAARLVAPADLQPEQVARLQDLAIRAYQALCCEGLARVDFFLTAADQLYISEINSMPGFTDISMYPRLWGLSGIPYPELIEQLIALARQRAGFFSSVSPIA